MVSQLKSLLGKTGRLLVVNGRLLCVGRSPIVAKLQSYKVAFETMNGSSEFSQDDGEGMIQKELNSFYAEFDEVFSGTGRNPHGVDMGVDPFTGAVIIETPAYKEMLHPEMHELDMQYSKRTAELLHSFITRYTSDWFDNYIYLFNRRIAAQHMPISVRGHFVAGLYQPLIVGTRALPSPLLYGPNQWFYSMLRGYEETLESSSSQARKVDLSCVAMCDICEVFHTPVIFELERRVWMLMVELLLLSKLSESASSDMVKKYNHLFRIALYNPEQLSRNEGRLLTDEQRAMATHKNNAQLFTAMVNASRNVQLSVR